MSKIGCKCGHIIVDQTDALPFKASFMRDLDLFDFYGGVENTIHRFQNLDLRDEENRTRLIDHIISCFIHYSNDLYECTQCGRVLVQQKQNYFQSFTPDSKTYNALLSIKTAPVSENE
ncbi:MAG: hypothetical protein RR676_18135 [Acinetobacter sp.]|jgi:hypothetical protein